MRSSATAAAAIELVIFARSCTGLKNLLRYARNTVSAPTVIASVTISRRASPEHESRAERHDDSHHGRKQRLHLPCLERRVDVAWLDFGEPRFLEILPRRRP